MQAIYDLLSDVQSLSGVSTAGDCGMLKRSRDFPRFLDAFRDHLLMSVETGTWLPFLYGDTFPPNMSKNACPFLRGLRSRIFGENGRILSVPDPVAFSLLYQVASFLEKFGSDVISEEMQNNAISSFLKDEEDIAVLCLEGNVELLGLARDLIESHILQYAEFYERPRHGPGAVSEGFKGPGEKYRFTVTPELEIFWPAIHPDANIKRNCVIAADGQEGKNSRLCFVPKNRRKCRIICAEPALLQYLQQGLRRPLYQALEDSPSVDINLRDQAVNRTVAKESSEHGYYATLDLKSASDRLSLQLVGALFPTPLFARMVACRSVSTTDPMSRKYCLQKFGSMGNALTFPVQTIVFWALICAQRMLCGDRETEAVADTWVYGDDIICPTHHAAAVMMMLESCGLKVNRDKSFFKGPFRESCGMHAFNGVDVTPAFLRTRTLDPKGLFSVLACARQLDSRGFYRTAEALYRRIEHSLKEKMPISSRDDCLSRYADPDLSVMDLVKRNQSRGIKVFSDRYQRAAVRAFVLRSRKGQFLSLDNTWDMWDLIGSSAYSDDRSHYLRALAGDEEKVADRGVIAGDICLAHAAVSLLV